MNSLIVTLINIVLIESLLFVYDKVTSKLSDGKERLLISCMGSIIIGIILCIVTMTVLVFGLFPNLDLSAELELTQILTALFNMGYSFLRYIDRLAKINKKLGYNH